MPQGPRPLRLTDHKHREDGPGRGAGPPMGRGRERSYAEGCRGGLRAVSIGEITSLSPGGTRMNSEASSFVLMIRCTAGPLPSGFERVVVKSRGDEAVGR